MNSIFPCFKNICYLHEISFLIYFKLFPSLAVSLVTFLFLFLFFLLLCLVSSKKLMLSFLAIFVYTLIFLFTWSSVGLSIYSLFLYFLCSFLNQYCQATFHCFIVIFINTYNFFLFYFQLKISVVFLLFAHIFSLVIDLFLSVLSLFLIQLFRGHSIIYFLITVKFSSVFSFLFCLI